MVLDADSAYLALKARDARFDGRLFVGVTSTGVYCRPVCRVRTPRRENCRFFDSRAQAEAARFRPCLKCRPEIAPGLSHTDSSRSLADSAARLIEQSVHQGEPARLPALAARLGVTDRHLRRIFQAAQGVSPHDYLNTQRLLLAKHLLTDTALPVTQVALASGFESLRRFNAAFAEHYRLNPTQLRRARGEPATRAATPLRLAYRPPLDEQALLDFFARRPLRGVEQVEGLSLRRTLAWTQQGRRLAGWFEARFVPDRHEVHVHAAPALAPVLGAVLQGVRQLFDLDADPALIDPVLASMPLPALPGLRLPGSVDGFELAVRVILGQQVTVKAACTLAQRLVDRFGEPVETPFPALTHLFPQAATLATADPATIGELGIVRQRVGALQALAAALAEGRLSLQRGTPLAPTMDALRALPGIGEWTAQLIAMRALAWPDAWPAADIGLMKALGTRDQAEITARAEAWRPWRAYAVMRLWHQLEQA
ncbi:Adenosine deaminase [Rubrivivax sp. A210]|uniref:Ada metal-binding domain-containing protein n=1 Tax=Rubrivivax sp. A210 TaxID=2772301 RepID=UPI00191AD2E5|nr:AlkA N-terminal domain-containing protein [Rubrivivax sp. A210]CAD5372248.1 Adenosine deaminase [Rubrivivax sp. A210]